MVLPAMLLANRGVVVFLLSPRGTEVPWEGIHQEVTLHARRALANELKQLVKGSEVALASISRLPEEFAEGSRLYPGRQSRRLDAGEFVSLVAGLVRTDTPGSRPAAYPKPGLGVFPKSLIPRAPTGACRMRPRDRLSQW